MTKEEWRAVVGYEGFYEVSSLGRVRSLTRLVPYGDRTTTIPGRMMKLVRHKHDYFHCGLAKDGYQRWFLTHRLVADAFLEPSDGRPEVNHIDGDRQNNRVSNLEWVSSRENQLHAYKTGLRIPMNGSSHDIAKLTEEQVLWIRTWLSEGFSQEKIAGVFGVKQTTISCIHRRVTWKHLDS